MIPSPPSALTHAPSETLRQAVHVSMVAFAGLLRFLTWPEAAAMAVAAVAFNTLWLGRVAPGIIRSADAAGHRAGVIFYPLSVLALVLVFRARLDIVAAAWAVMACGDGAATLAGMRFGGPRLPWNPAKTWTGLTGFVLAGGAGAVAFAAWVAPAITPAPSWAFTVWASVAAAVVAAFVETIPVRLDDNLSVPFAAGAVLLLANQIDAPHVLDAWPAWVERLPWALVVNGAVASAAWWRGSITRAGAVVGAALGVAICLGAGWGGWMILLTAFVAALVASRVGRRQKEARGIDDAHEARRGAGNTWANCVVGAAGAWVMAVGDHATAGSLMLAAGLVAGASDTVASEIGKAFGGTPRRVPSWDPVPPGTPGAVSAAGTAAGLVSAVAMAIASSVLLRGGVTMVLAVAVGATVGAFTESALATRFEARGILNNDVLNFLNTAVAAGVALLVAHAPLTLLGTP